MLDALFFILKSVADIFTGVLLLRFWMQWARVPFRNPLGRFVMAATDWIVLPVRKAVPGALGLDWPSLLIAWLTQFLLLMILFGIGAYGFTGAAIGMAAVSALVAVVRVFLYLVFWIVLVMAVMSWINPYAPLAPVINALARPFLAPFQRVIPPLGGMDLSPIVLILLIQLLLRFLP